MESVEMREKWEVEYSRFLNYPPREATEAATVACPHLKVRRITKTREENGTWLTASSSADLKLIVDWFNADVIMRVQYQGKIMEEHFVSKLNISWPQVSCESGFPPRGTRVLIVTYRDKMEEVQKFGFRFLTICDLEALLNTSKVYMQDARRTSHINCNKSEFSSPQIYRPRMDFDSRTPLISHQIPSSSNCGVDQSSCPHRYHNSPRELASISDFNKWSSSSNNFYQQSVVEVSRASSCHGSRTLKSVRRRMKKGLTDSSPSTFKVKSATPAVTEADNGRNQELSVKENANSQSMILMHVEEPTHIRKKALDDLTDQQGINEQLNEPIRWHRSSETITKHNSHNRIPTLLTLKTSEASDAHNPVPPSSNIELEECEKHQDTSNNNKHDSLEAFPPSFTTLLSSCFPSTEQAAAPESAELVVDDLKSQIAMYLKDSNFQDMLMKVEKVISELGYVDVLDR